jgi:hypothetical protein
MFRKSAVLLFAAVTLLGACDENTAPGDEVTYVVMVGTETFRVRAEGNAKAALEARRQSGVVGVISGRLVRGNGGFNAPYGWHIDPASITAPDLAMELCDGKPSFIDPEIDYWVDTVKYYCPWGAKVISVE